MLRPSEVLVKLAATRKNRHPSSVQSRVEKQAQATYLEGRKTLFLCIRPSLWVRVSISYDGTSNGFIWEWNYGNCPFVFPLSELLWKASLQSVADELLVVVWAPWCGRWDPHSSLMEGQQMLLSTEPSLQLPQAIVLIHIFLHHYILNTTVPNILISKKELK